MTEESAIVVEVTRGDIVESLHRVAACAVDAAGREIYTAGNVEMPVYLRSTAKPFIAAAAIEAGAREAFGLDQREIAVMAASHSGEPMHVEAVRSILHKIGMDGSALQCGTHAPYDEASARALLLAGEPPTVLHNNCSGKHAGILALCKCIGADPTTYLSPQNPAQRCILDLCARLSDDDSQTWPLAVDGCGIPVYATTLRRAARSFARFASLSNMLDSDAEALRVVRDAMVAYPEYVAGTGQFDTELMRAGRGGIAAKAGAEGVHGVAAIALGYGYVSKVIDGGSRGRGPSTVGVLRRIGVLDERQCAELERFARPALYNRAGVAVGEVRAIV
ncbi:MAG TPA: asparaginase [Candidatus Cybelea sp.]|nr:asparaginase [Candidatus Cybelea sp.]